jgi:hypothetical protein
MEAETLDDKQSCTMEYEKTAESVVESIKAATSCETIEDFNANVKEAIEIAQQLVKDLKDLL